jgi:hypothetical protein
MRLIIEIAAAALLVFCISATSAAAAGKSADGLSCSFSVPQGASPAVRCHRDQAAMRRKVLRQLLRRQAAVGDVRRTRPFAVAALAWHDEARSRDCRKRRPEPSSMRLPIIPVVLFLSLEQIKNTLASV